MSNGTSDTTTVAEHGPVAALCAALEQLGLDGPLTVQHNRQGSALDGLALVPNAQKPRMVVPAGTHRAAASALRRYSSALGSKERIQRALAATAIGLWGARAPLASHRLTLSLGTQRGIIEHLGNVLGEPVNASLTVGTERANRKPVLQLFSAHGRPLAFAKVGTNDFTANLVDHEAHALGRLQQHNFQRLRTPQLLHHGSWNGHSFLLMEVLPATALGASRRINELRHQAQDELQRVFHGGTQLLGESSWLAVQYKQLGQVPEGHQGFERLHQGLDRLASRYGGQSVVLGATHGDWTAWNMAAHRGKLNVWDFERFATDVPSGFDTVHYALNTVPAPWTSDALAAALAGTGVPHAVGAAYLADLAGRYLLGGLQRPVQGIEDKALMLVETLEKILGD